MIFSLAYISLLNSGIYHGITYNFQIERKIKMKNVLVKTALLTVITLITAGAYRETAFLKTNNSNVLTTGFPDSSPIEINIIIDDETDQYAE